MSNIRFMDNNLGALTTSAVTFSSELSAFPFTNVLNSMRSKVWKPSGNFTITSSNRVIYFNDGSNQSVNLDLGDYESPAVLATSIAFKLNSVSSGWSCSYSTTTYKFTISRSSSGTIRLSQTTNAVWNTIGFVTTSDLTGLSFVANEQRNHTSEFVQWDLGYNASITFFALICPAGERLNLSPSSTITLKANNVSDFTSPPLSVTLTPNEAGIYYFFADGLDTGYRYWKFEFIDKFNTEGPEGFTFGHLYLGDYTSLTTRNISTGIGFELADPSETISSENGVLYFDEKTKYSTFENLSFELIQRDDRDTLRNMFDRLGKTTPFYVSLDPALCISNDISEFTKYAVFENAPTFKHVIHDYFNMDFKIREVI